MEAPLGIAGVFLVSRGEKTPWRLKLRTPSFNNISSLEQVLVGVRYGSVGGDPRLDRLCRRRHRQVAARPQPVARCKRGPRASTGTVLSLSKGSTHVRLRQLAIGLIVRQNHVDDLEVVQCLDTFTGDLVLGRQFLPDEFVVGQHSARHVVHFGVRFVYDRVQLRFTARARPPEEN